MFRWDYDKPRIGTWCHEIKTILNQHNIGHYYSIIPAPRGVNISAILTQKLCDEQKAVWDTSRHMPKLSNYNKVKYVFSVPRYVFQHLTRQERSALAKLYCGNLPLKVETGRYRNIPREQRLCTTYVPVMCWTMRFTSSSNVNDIPKDRNIMLNNININGLTKDETFLSICINISPKYLANFIIKGLITRRN